MKIFYSGGSPIVERTLDHPSVMLSFHSHVRHREDEDLPDSRMRTIMRMNRKNKKKGKKNAKGK